MATTALIDGDILLYRCGFACEKTYYLVYGAGSESPALYSAHRDIPKDTPKEHIWSRKEVDTEDNAVRALDATLANILAKLGTDQYELYLSDSRTFRHELAVTKPYKGNRDGAPRPVHYGVLKSRLLDQHRGTVWPKLEADDCLSIRATEMGADATIVSIDKDFSQIPGRYFNWVNGEMGEVTPRDATISLGCQILSGDSIDNIPGIAGLGPAKSRKLIGESSNTKEMVERIRSRYRDYMGDNGESYLLEQGSLVYLLRSRDDSFKQWLEKYS